jgi:hypothetical protein
VDSRGIVHSLLGVSSLEKLVIFVLPMFERTHLTTRVMVDGFVKMASPEFGTHMETSGKVSKKVNKFLETHQIESSSCNFFPPSLIKHGPQEDHCHPEEGTDQGQKMKRRDRLELALEKAQEITGHSKDPNTTRHLFTRKMKENGLMKTASAMIEILSIYISRNKTNTMFRSPLLKTLEGFTLVHFHNRPALNMEGEITRTLQI